MIISDSLHLTPVPLSLSSTSPSHPVLAFSVAIKLDLTVCPHLLLGSLKPCKLNKLAQGRLVGRPRHLVNPSFQASKLLGET